MVSTVKRFIAGAVCPRCAEMDRITMYQEEGVQYRECIACGFKDQQGGFDESDELPTRVNQNQAQPVKVEPVVFFRSAGDKEED